MIEGFMALLLFQLLGEAIAHLNYLWRAGELRRDSDAADIHRFVRML